MFTQERDYFPWIVCVLVIGGMGGLYWLKQHRVVAQSAPQPQATTIPTPVVAHRTSPRASTASVAAISAREVVSLYDCSVGQQRSYSDRPCANGGVQRDLEITLNTYTSPPMPRPAPPVQVVERRTENHYYYQDVEPQIGAGSPTCDSLFAAKKRVDAEMRGGYGNERGEWLRERHRRITTQIYEFRCLSGR